MEQPSSDPQPQAQQRLQKIIAAAGIASRRRAEEIIASGRVSIDDKIVKVPGTMADPYTQRITVDGRQIDTTGTRRYYVALHKPTGYVSTVSDRHAEKKVTDLVRIPGVRLVPAGRLDADSEGLILLSNDGDFIYRVTHPSQSLGKLYQATVKGKPTEETIKTLSKGLSIGEGEVTSPAHALLIGRGQESGSWIVELTLGEGRNRQVRRMLDTVGHPVIRLVRLRVGPVRLSGLEPGMWRELTADEVRRILTGDKSGEANGLSAGNGGRRPAAPRTNNYLPPQRPGSRPPQKPSGGLQPRSSSGAPPRPSNGNGPPRFSAPRPGGSDRPPQGVRPQGRPFQGPPSQVGRPGTGGGGGARPNNDRSRSDRPYSDRPRGDAPNSNDRPRNDRPYMDRPRGDGQQGSRPPQSGRPPQPGRPPQGGPPQNRPYTGDRENRPPRPGGDRPYNSRPSGNSGDRPFSGGGDNRPQPRGNAPQGDGQRSRPFYTGPRSSGQGPTRPQGPRPPRPFNPGR